MNLEEGSCVKGGVNNPPTTPRPPPPKGQGSSHREFFEIMSKKESLLSEIIVWLKAKNLWEDCKKDLSIQIT